MQVRVEAGPEHPFYVFRQGWSSVSPALTRAIYNLPAHPLNVGDVCISLTQKVCWVELSTIIIELFAPKMDLKNTFHYYLL